MFAVCKMPLVQCSSEFLVTEEGGLGPRDSLTRHAQLGRPILGVVQQIGPQTVVFVFRWKSSNEVNRGIESFFAPITIGVGIELLTWVSRRSSYKHSSGGHIIH